MARIVMRPEGTQAPLVLRPPALPSRKVARMLSHFAPEPAYFGSTSEEADYFQPTPAAWTPLPVVDEVRSWNGPPQGSNNKAGKIAGTVIGVIFPVAALLAVLLWLYRRRKAGKASRNDGDAQPQASTATAREGEFMVNVHGDSKEVTNDRKIPESSGSINSSNSVQSSTPTPRGTNSFTYEELFGATNGFSKNNVIGQGGFGHVYQGVLSNGKIAAIKQLKVGSFQGEREFLAEIDTISRIHHRNLVSLIGYSIDRNQMLLVYEYMANNSLAYHLHASEAQSVLSWDLRMQIAVGSAKGLAYLHEDCDPKIIHRDIKANNILLDWNFNAKVSDFGLAKFVEDAETHVTTRVMGTFGYLAPEYASSGKLTEKSDVYSFGVVLLELISGRAPLNLVEWVRPLLPHALTYDIYDKLADPKLNNCYDNVGMSRMVACVEACIHPFANNRPQMNQIVRVLEGIMTPNDLRRQS